MKSVGSNKRKKIIFIATGVPCVNGKGYQVLLYNRINEFKSIFDCEVIVVPPVTNIFRKLEVTDGMPNIPINVVAPSIFDCVLALLRLFTLTPLQVSLYTRKKLVKFEKSADIVYFLTSRCIQSNSGLDNKTVCDFVDSMYVNFRRKVSVSFLPLKLIFLYEAHRMRRHEEVVCKSVGISLCVSHIDRHFIGKKCHVVRLGVEQSMFQKEFTGFNRANKIVFSGSLNYEPNIMAIKWFIKKIYPKLIVYDADVSFSVIGRGASHSLIKFLEGHNNVHYVGEVPNIMDELLEYDISIAPMISGSGMQFKILEAMSVGIPVVATTLAKGDINAADKRDILIADTPDEFAHCIRMLISNRAQRASIAKNAQILVKNEHSWPAVCGQVADLLKKLPNKHC